jgi:P27 family predicted phage terminase small subunit
MGRPRKSKRLKKLQGTHRKDREPPKPPPPGVPTMPRWLDADAKAEWKALAPKLEALGILYEHDASLLANLCTANARAAKATRDYQRKGLMITSFGQRQKNPSVKVAQEAASAALMHTRIFEKRLELITKEEGIEAVRARGRGGAAPATAPAAVNPSDKAEGFFFGGPKLVQPSPEAKKATP